MHASIQTKPKTKQSKIVYNAKQHTYNTKTPKTKQAKQTTTTYQTTTKQQTITPNTTTNQSTNQKPIPTNPNKHQLHQVKQTVIKHKQAKQTTAVSQKQQ